MRDLNYEPITFGITKPQGIRYTVCRVKEISIRKNKILDDKYRGRAGERENQVLNGENWSRESGGLKEMKRDHTPSHTPSEPSVFMFIYKTASSISNVFQLILSP